MLELTLFNFALVILIVIALIVCKKCAKNEKTKKLILMVAPIITIVCHYSSLVYHYFLNDSAFTYLRHNPNLILPIYPCNVVMWSALIIGFMKDRESKLYKLLVDYVFWFGIISTLVGMFANVDFIRNPTLADFDITKGIVAHATLLFNVLLLPVFGNVRIDLKRNMKSMLISVLGMYVIGLYCNLIFKTLVSDDLAYQVNSMFILHSPFEGVDFLTYPTIAVIAIAMYFISFHIAELIAYKNGDRWYNRK